MLTKILIATALLMALPAIAAEEKPEEKNHALTVYGGYRGGGHFTDANTGQSLSLESNGAVSLALDLPYTASGQYQIFFSRKQTNLKLDTAPFAGSNKLFTSIWFWLVLLTLVEIFLAYKPMPIHFMLTILLGLSIIKAALIVAYFMHLKFERLSLILTIVPMLVVCICLLFVFFPDSFRSAGLRYEFKEAPPPPAAEEH